MLGLRLTEDVLVQLQKCDPAVYTGLCLQEGKKHRRLGSTSRDMGENR